MNHCSEMAELDKNIDKVSRKRFDMKHKSKAKVDKIAQAVSILKSESWQSMNDKFIVQRVIEILEAE